MGLSHYSEFTAPSTGTANALAQFLKALEFKAKTLGFSPTSVLNVSFDTPERRAFARRLGGGYYVEDERLREGQADYHSAQTGSVRLVPVRAVVLAATDAVGCERCFGFMKFPSCLVDESGAAIMPLAASDRWLFKDSINTPDPRYRAIVSKFERGGSLASSSDEFTCDGSASANLAFSTACG